MGFNKRFIKREMIVNNNNLSYISILVNADALIIDDWSDKFYKNFDFKWEEYNKLRSELISETSIFSDGRKIIEHNNFKNLKRLSNIYMNLKSNPEWVDIHLAHSIFEDIIPDDISGKFDKLVEYFINKIDDKLKSHI